MRDLTLAGRGRPRAGAAVCGGMPQQRTNIQFYSSKYELDTDSRIGKASDLLSSGPQIDSFERYFVLATSRGRRRFEPLHAEDAGSIPLPAPRFSQL